MDRLVPFLPILLLCACATVDPRRRVDLNLYPPSSDARADFHRGDGTFIMRNALLYR